MGRFQKRSFFCENETIVFENDRLMNQNTIVKRSFSKTINDPTDNTKITVYEFLEAAEIAYLG